MGRPRMSVSGFDRRRAPTIAPSATAGQPAPVASGLRGSALTHQKSSVLAPRVTVCPVSPSSARTGSAISEGGAPVPGATESSCARPGTAANRNRKARSVRRIGADRKLRTTNSPLRTSLAALPAVAARLLVHGTAVGAERLLRLGAPVGGRVVRVVARPLVAVV